MKNKNTIESLKKEKLITTADKIPVKNKVTPITLITKEDLDKWYSEQQVRKKEEWVLEIENYCNTAGILPSDLITTHKLSLKRNLKAKTTQETHVSEKDVIQNKSKKNWRNDFIKNKTGYSPE